MSEESISFRVQSPSKDVFVIKPDGTIWVNPEYPQDEAATVVLEALEEQIKYLVRTAKDELIDDIAYRLDHHPIGLALAARIVREYKDE